MSSYLQWNDAVVEHFFRSEMASRSVYLYVTEELVSELGKRFDGTVADFVSAVKEGPSWVTREGLCQRALQACENWRTRGLTYPPYALYLALFVLAAGVEGDFAPHAYYPRLRLLLGYPDGGMLPSFDRMLELWDDLERWSVRDRGGGLGMFTARFIGGWIHVGVPIAQRILTDQERAALPEIFSEAGLDPNSPPPEAELARVLRTHSAGRLAARTLDLLATRRDEEQYSVLLHTVAEELTDWDGSLQGGLPGAPTEARAFGTVRLCLRLDVVAGRAQVTARCRLGREFPQDRLVLASSLLPSPVWCDEFLPGWSIPLLHVDTDRPLDGSELSWMDGALFTDESSRWHFKLAGRPVRVFVEGSGEGLPGLIEVYQIPLSRSFYLLFHTQSWQKLEPWLHDECSGFVEYRVNEGLRPSWRLAKVDRALSDRKICGVMPFLAFPEQLRIRFQGGIRHSRGNTFFAFAPPELSVEGGGGGVVTCQGHVLPPVPGTERYKLPSNLPRDSRIAIEVKREAEVIARQSLYLSADFTWRRPSPLREFDRWGEPVREPAHPQVRMAGAAVYGIEKDSDGFTLAPFMTPWLERRPPSRVFFVGRAPGQILRWPDEPVPAAWQPVWAVALRKRGHAVYCGNSMEESTPLDEPRGDRKQVRAWKDLLWHHRKRIAAPKRVTLAHLWKRYQEAARYV